MAKFIPGPEIFLDAVGALTLSIKDGKVPGPEEVQTVIVQVNLIIHYQFYYISKNMDN